MVELGNVAFVFSLGGLDAHLISPITAYCGVRKICWCRLVVTDVVGGVDPRLQLVPLLGGKDNFFVDIEYFK